MKRLFREWFCGVRTVRGNVENKHEAHLPTIPLLSAAYSTAKGTGKVSADWVQVVLFCTTQRGNGQHALSDRNTSNLEVDGRKQQNTNESKK